MDDEGATHPSWWRESLQFHRRRRGSDDDEEGVNEPGAGFVELGDYDYDWAYEGDDDDDGGEATSRSEVIPFHWKRENFTTGCAFMWLIGWALLGNVVDFWTPGVSLLGINVRNMIMNIIGAFISAIVTAFEQVKFQYVQTYLMYQAIKNGYCGVITTFGDVIEETQDLVINAPYYPALIHLAGNLILGLIAWWLGRLVALKWKAGAAFSFELMRMENEDRRMALEVEREWDRESTEQDLDVSAPPPPQIPSPEPILTTPKERSRPESPSGRPRRSSTPSPEPLADVPLMPHRSLHIVGKLGDVSTKRAQFVETEQIHGYLNQQVAKSHRHVSVLPKRRHWFILSLLYGISFLQLAILAVFPGHLFHNELEGDHLYFGYVCGSILSVLGALIGGFWGSVEQSRYVFQWGTFRVNITSCILIAIAHNILLFRLNFPDGDDGRFVIFWSKFIGSFCGTESSFAGLVDDTAILWMSNAPRRYALRNVFFNWFIGQALYLFVSFSIRYVVLYVGA